LNDKRCDEWGMICENYKDENLIRQKGTVPIPHLKTCNNGFYSEKRIFVSRKAKGNEKRAMRPSGSKENV
jgi:hypothetical protein